MLREVQRLSQDEGVSLAGIQRILDLVDQVQALRAQVSELSSELDVLKLAMGAGSRVFAAGRAGEVVAVRPGQRPTSSVIPSRALVVWQARG
jgi:MerR family transcriptional regulator/heat shock protein HspR